MTLTRSPRPVQLPGSVRRVAVIVAHPDDETLWTGGLLLSHPEWTPTIVTLCRGLDPDRAPRFRTVLERFQAAGAMADLDDGPEQLALDPRAVQEAILALLPEPDFDLILSHGLLGEYTQHRRHVEVARAVLDLCGRGRLRSPRLWLFAYEDGGGQYLPCACQDADLRLALGADLWRQKAGIIRDLYGFEPASWEVRATPRTEGFHCFQH